ncbi:hypothetical protein BD626DRAFT_517894 [Schizophyllum amplum]|uniref:Uncharacterized protein n=1 Tax=Schizophyllum amplum TaxID=97359 RepID=A0A550BVZ9_9AGAR|nr:hypothetical protein BD626DRAFT_517894 [Auriculariopsis ampla]
MRGVVVAVCGVVVVVRGLVGVRGLVEVGRRSLCRRSLCAGPSYSPWRVTASRVRTRRTHERRALVAAPRSTPLIVAAPRLLIARTHPRVPSWTFAWDFCHGRLPSCTPPIAVRPFHCHCHVPIQLSLLLHLGTACSFFEGLPVPF